MGKLKNEIHSEKSLGLWAFCLTLLLTLVFAAPSYSQQISLYFPQHNGLYLGLEKREITLGSSLTEEARNVILTMMAGPQTNLIPIFNSGEHLRQVYIDQAEIAYVDLAATAFRGMKGGVLQERLNMWSLVNSLCLNLEGIKAVEVLIGGQKVKTLFGHLDLSYPLYPDLSLVK
ncbi:MAG: GerMN domain-containing protein [Deltaproteobacteria bacterium]|nr:GerMN domain-containing protein [Deltaproteobacteria bacterium]MBW2140029.1 GerMN domain-containing protein [Deltaproteobacteria bacterium]MBW2321908.1 GerMN domain-containing protein [Deltaproteobacteria bacterium]